LTGGHPPTQEEIDGALSARWSPEELARREREDAAAALDAGFEVQPISRETVGFTRAEGEAVVKAVTEAVGSPLPLVPKWPIVFPVTRFQLVDLPTWGAWLIPKLQEQWPEVAAQNFAGMMRNWMGSNEHLFVRTDNSCALSVSVPHPLWGYTVVRGMFCWSRYPSEQGAELHLVQLHRFAVDWAKSRYASRFEVFEVSDLQASRVDFFLRPEKVVMRHIVTR
jgi:hypothetical protein